MNVFIADCYRDCLGPQSCAVARGAGLLAEIAVQSFFDVFAFGRLPSAHQVRDDAFEPYAVFVLVFLIRAVHQEPSYLFGQLPERQRFINAEVPAKAFDQAVIKNVHPLAALAPGVNRAVFERLGFIRHNQFRVKFENCPQAVAAFARAIRAVKAE